MDDVGRRLRPERSTDRFRELFAPAGFPVIRLHNRRGTVNSAMTEEVVPPEVRAAILGHDPRTNLGQYTVVSAETMAATMRTASGG